MDPLTNAAAGNITQLAEYGIAGLLAGLLIIGAVFMLRYFMQHCEKRTDMAMSSLEKLNDRQIEVTKGNTEALHGVQIALAELKSRGDHK